MPMKKITRWKRQDVSVNAQKSVALVVPTKLSAGAEEEFERALDSALAASPPSIDFDCSRLEHVSSRHVNLLWQAHLRCQEIGAAMALVAPSPGLIRVLKVLDLYDFFVADDRHSVRHLQEAVQTTVKNAETVYADEFRSNPEEIETAAHEFLGFLKGLPIPELIEFELRTIFYEVATNISSHAGIGDDGTIVFVARFEPVRLTMTFADSGVYFDPTSVSTTLDMGRAARGRQRRGFGVTMVAKLSDRMEYVRRHDAINLLTLEKKWSLS